MSQLQCPSCGYRSDDADFTVSGGTAGTSDAAKSGSLGTPQPQADSGSTGFRPQQLGVKGMANRRQAVELARRTPVTSVNDILVSRTAGGPAVIRHRQGGAQIAEMRHNDDGSWQTVVDGALLSPHAQQRAALMEALGTWNRSAAAERPAPQPALSGVTALASGGDDGDDDDDQDGGSDDNGLTPRGQQIHMKLKKKGVAPKVALAMAKRAQATKPGVFGKAS